MIKHYKLYYDGQHYVRDKRFDSLYELVADGLVTLYMEANAGPYIELMNNFNNYEKSPYMTLNKLKRRAVISQATRRTDISTTTNSFLQKEQKHSEISGLQTRNPVITESVNSEGFISEAMDYDKPHAFKIHTFKGLNWCEFCGNFLWGFTAQGVKCEGIYSCIPKILMALSATSQVSISEIIVMTIEMQCLGTDFIT
jgi:hypothetical protein